MRYIQKIKKILSKLDRIDKKGSVYMKENFENITKSNIIKMLKYAATALSAVSFLTTLNGVNGIVTDSVWLAGLISFGIQTIILVMGLWFLPAGKIIWEQNIKKWLRKIIVFFMIALYLCAIVFSSFFSYVYMSNAAYANVRPTDYNMELELFLIDNTRVLRNYNDAVYNVLLKNIRRTAPKFRTLVESLRQTTNDEIDQIIGQIPKCEDASIPDEMKFSTEEAIIAYEVPNKTTASTELRDDCQRLEENINGYVEKYNEYYKKYELYYEYLTGQKDMFSKDIRKKDIDNLISSLNEDVKNLQEFNYRYYSSINDYLQIKCKGIISQYNNLIRESETLEKGYDELYKYQDVTQGKGLTLQNFYEVIYSSDISTRQKFDQARSDLQKVVSAYIQDSDEIDEENIYALVECIEWLDKLNQCKELRDNIEQFEKTDLIKSYTIVSDGSENNGTDNDIEDVKIEQVEESEWNAARHTDVTEFISLVKSLPESSQILGQDGDEDDSSIFFLRKMEQENYVSNILLKAYKYSREKLEKISNLERAWNYLYSENNFLAILCFCIAIFLDIASFLIGLYMYSSQDIAGKKIHKEN